MIFTGGSFFTVSIESVLDFFSSLCGIYKLAPLLNEYTLRNFSDRLICVAPQAQWMRLPGFFELSTAAAPPPEHIALWVAILESLVEELRKLHHVHERVLFVCKLGCRIVA